MQNTRYAWHTPCVLVQVRAKLHPGLRKLGIHVFQMERSSGLVSRHRTGAEWKGLLVHKGLNNCFRESVGLDHIFRGERRQVGWTVVLRSVREQYETVFQSTCLGRYKFFPPDRQQLVYITSTRRLARHLQFPFASLHPLQVVDDDKLRLSTVRSINTERRPA